MNKTELHKLQDYLQRTFGNKALKVLPHQSDADRADVSLGERRIATIAGDDEDGELLLCLRGAELASKEGGVLSFAGFNEAATTCSGARAANRRRIGIAYGRSFRGSLFAGQVGSLQGRRICGRHFF